MPDEQADTLASADHPCDQNDRARDHDDHASEGGGREDQGDVRARDQNDHGGDHAQKDTPYRQYAENHPDPNGEGKLQVWPLRTREEFDSDEKYWNWMDAFSRWNNLMPPPKPVPEPEDIASAVPEASTPPPGWYRRSLKSRHVGIRLTDRDYELLVELARAHSVALGTMARMLVARGVRASIEPEGDD